MRNQINSSSHQSLFFQVPHGHKLGTFPTSLTQKSSVLSPVIDTSVNWRTGSFHGYWGRRGCGREASSLAAASLSPRDVRGPLATLDHRLSVYDNVPAGSDGSESTSGAERTAEEAELSRLMEGQDVFSALDSVLERISRLQQLVSSWSESLSEDNGHTGSSSSSSQDSPGSSAGSSSPSHIHLEVQCSEEEVEEEGSGGKAPPFQRSR